MPDALSRWCLFCDLEVHSAARHGPRVIFDDYVDDVVSRSDRGEAYRIYDRENRVMRVAHARRLELPNGRPGIAMVLTLGDRRGSDPSFLHFDMGHARDAEKRAGEVKGRSAHCIVELVEDEDNVGRYRMLLEEATGLGRTPVSRLLATLLRDISTDRDERFRSPDTGNLNQVQPTTQVWPQKSRAIGDALARGRLGVVELYDTGRVPAFDEVEGFRVKKRVLRIDVMPDGEGIQNALERLRLIARQEGYGNMKVSWRLQDGQVAYSDMRTDLEDIGTALLARRELVTVEQPMSDASHRLIDDFVEAMAAHFD